MFSDRTEAGRLLAAEIAMLALRDPVVLALPRGGVPVGYEIADALDAPLDILVVRKVGAPDNPELALAALVDGDPPDIVVNREIAEAYGLDGDEVDALAAGERPELRRRRAAYRGTRPAAPVRGRTALLVDDGAATGTTMKAAARAMRKRAPERLVIALPVASPEALAELTHEADTVVCLARPAHFRALGLHYEAFPQLSDAEVIEILERAEEAAETRGQDAPG